MTLDADTTNLGSRERVTLGALCAPARSLADQRLAQAHLSNRPLEDLFVDGSGSEQPVNEDRPGLSVSVNSSHSLQVVRRVPVAVY